MAEQVEKVDPDIVARDQDGRPYTVRYEAVNAMLLNEFLKEHRKVAKLKEVGHAAAVIQCTTKPARKASGGAGGGNSEPRQGVRHLSVPRQEHRLGRERKRLGQGPFQPSCNPRSC